ncbi:Alpha-ketoglutarate-dependent dioxygenase alkB 6 [Podila clonocystis]|nr:Alpha-ketoglutarate-dependent dioxygenase alkB 6 [Podila clonocystis]
MTRSIGNGKVRDAPDSVYYLPDFISVEEEQTLINKVLTAPKPKWVHLKNRRLQNWGGIVTNNGMIAESLPAWLTNLHPRFQESGVFDGLHPALNEPNHCLVNEYLAGQGILPHKDGPAYLPTVATVSLSSHCILEFYKCPSDSEPGMDKLRDSRSQEPEFSILVQPRSLLVLKSDVYNTYMHGIREIAVDNLAGGNILNLAEAFPGVDLSEARSQQLERGSRISLTFRIVEKTKSGKKFLFGR